MEEIWLAVVGCEGWYEVSNLGRVRSLDRISARGRRYRGRVLTQSPIKPSGHLVVNLRRDGTGRTRLVHELIAQAFMGPRPEGHHTHHIDGDPTNNRESNLKYVPAEIHKRVHGWGKHDGTHVRGESNRLAKLTDEKVRHLRVWAAEGVPSHEIADRLGVHERSVRNVLKGRAWRHVD